MAASGTCVQKVEEGVAVRAPRDRFGTVMTERVQHNGVVGLTRECESTSHRGDPERGSVEPSDHIFVFRRSLTGIGDTIYGYVITGLFDSMC